VAAAISDLTQRKIISLVIQALNARTDGCESAEATVALWTAIDTALDSGNLELAWQLTVDWIDKS
jgi:hypothetical protein